MSFVSPPPRVTGTLGQQDIGTLGHLDIGTSGCQDTGTPGHQCTGTIGGVRLPTYHNGVVIFLLLKVCIVPGNFPKIIKHMWVSGGCREIVWRMSGGCLVGIWWVSGGCLNGVLKVPGGCLEGIYGMSEW